MLRLECGFIALALLIAALHPSIGSSWFEKWERGFVRVARQRGLSVVVVGISTLALRAALLPILPLPEPIVHDEFGYLLAADTFAHGRITNPTHPMWRHFETFHVIQQPTYCTKYFPAQGLFLALGQVAFGHPFWGVWMSTGMMCAAITWMLQGWLAPEWALLGGVLSLLRYGIFGYWMNSYWGGSVAAIGGALALGALPRIKSAQRLGDAVWMGIGLSLLAASRPWEGLVFGFSIAVLLLVWILGKNRPAFHVVWQKVVSPIAMGLAITIGAFGYYCWRTTGRPTMMPYQIEHEIYGVAPYMLWQHTRKEPDYRYEVMRRMYVGEELVGYHVFRSPIGYLLKAYMAWLFLLGPVLTLPFLMLAVALPQNFSWRNIERSTLSLLFVLGAFALGSIFAIFYNPHYSAPVTAAILALVLIAMRQVRNWGRAGLFIVRASCIICLLSFTLRTAAGPLHFALNRSVPFSWHEEPPRSFGRAIIVNDLERLPGNHLVIVHYRSTHEPFAEWVYNEAEIDKAKIVWAREMEPTENRRLLDYFKDRQAWLLDADETPPKLSPIHFTNSHIGPNL
jgi:hypothetical protein